MPNWWKAGSNVFRWLSLTVFVGVSALTVFLVLEMQHERLYTDAEQQARTDIKLIRSFVRDSIQKQDHQSTRSILQHWGGTRSEILEISLVAANGYVIGEFRRERPALDSLRLSEQIPHGYQGITTLDLVWDLGPLEQNLTRLRVELVVTASVLVLIFWLLLGRYLRSKQEVTASQLHVQELVQANERLGAGEKDLDRLQAYLENVLDSIPSVLVGVDADSCITEWNKGAEEFTHTKREEAIGQLLSELMPHLNEQLDGIRQAIAERRSQRMPRLVRLVGGMARYSEAAVYPLTDREGTAAIIRVDDVTQRVRFEQIIMQTEKLTSLGGLVAGVAHEINSPLSGVLQNCQNVVRRLSLDLEANQRTADAVGVDLQRLERYLQERKIPVFLDMIREAAERAGRIVTDMLVFTRPSSVSCDKVYVADLLESAVRLASHDNDLKKNANFGRVAVIRNIADGLPALHCDRPHLEQVLFNLIRNAAQAMAVAETPFPRRIILHAQQQAGCIRLEVEDNGPGMREEVKQRIYEPFFTTKAPGAGAGLGLSVAYFIVTEKLGGRIDVASQPGAGSRFTIQLPIKSDRTPATTGS